MRRPFYRFAFAALAVAFGLGAPALALAQHASSAEVPYSPKAAVVPALRLPAGHNALLVALPVLDAAIVDNIRQQNTRTFTKRLQIGVGRDLFDAASSSTALRWTPVAGGSAAQWKIVSGGAAALRVGLDASGLGEGVELRFASTAEPGVVYGPFTRHDVAELAATYWSPVLEGESAIVEVFVPDALSPADANVQVVEVSHLFVSPKASDTATLQKATSEFCEVDLICRSATDSALASTGRAVAKMVFSDGAGSFLCTGTLLNTTNASGIPYFYSANHCINTQSVANTITTHWFYDRTGCGSGSVSFAYTQLTGGATLVYTDQDTDVSFMRLNNAPPAGALMAGWDATPPSIGAALTAVHHPNGDVKKVSLGSAARFDSPFDFSTNFIVSQWNSISTGVTEGGSSGSGIFTAVGSPPSEYRLRGGLFGGPSSCQASQSELYDYYSRFDLAYGAALSQYLSPAGGPAPNYTGLWWNPNESGWGINFDQQGDIVFGTLFTYDANGKPMWLVMSNGARQSGDTFSGTLYRTTGPAFNAQPFTPIGPENLTTVGRMTVSFSGNTATLSYNVNANQIEPPLVVNKNIQKQVFGSRAANCASTTGDRSGLTNYQDLWWNPNESGWGVNVTQQDDTLFATLFTYDSNNQGLWLVMSQGIKQSAGWYLGDLYQTTGPAFNAQPFTPIGPANITKVGTMQFRFSDGQNGTLTYSVNGTIVNKTITRQVFSTPVPSCN